MIGVLNLLLTVLLNSDAACKYLRPFSVVDMSKKGEFPHITYFLNVGQQLTRHCCELISHSIRIDCRIYQLVGSSVTLVHYLSLITIHYLDGFLNG